MAFFDKLFIKKRKQYDDCHESRDRGRSNKLTNDHIRLLLFKECDWRGRKVLFDSSTLQKVPANKNDKANLKQHGEPPYIVEVSNGYSYVYKGPAQDACALGEMIFGAVAMNYKGVSFKIHIMDEPKRLMCTKIFCVPSSRRISRVDRKQDVEAPNYSGSKPLNVPQGREEGSLSFSFDRGDSGFCGEHSMHSSVSSSCDFFTMFDDWEGNASNEDFYVFHSPSGRRLSLCSNGSWQRRTFRNMATKFDLGSQSSNLLSVPTSASNITSCDSQIYSNSSTSGTSDSLASGSSSTAQKRNKLGLALLITAPDSEDVDVIRKCMEHSAQLQALVCRLRLATIAAGSDNGFISTLHKASVDAAEWLSDLLYGPRVQPMWLSLLSSQNNSGKLAEKLLSEFCNVLSVGDTKHTNFFVSTLLTHVLTYHLGWVATVSPYDVHDGQASTEGDVTAQPYNALWAQLSDLCGSIGYPPRSAKTIISGANKAQFVNRLLVVLTYFVRCGEVNRRDVNFKKCDKTIYSVKVPEAKSTLKRTTTRANNLTSLKVPFINTDSDSCETLVPSDVSVKASMTIDNCNQLSCDDPVAYLNPEPMSSQINSDKLAIFTKSTSSSSLNSSEGSEQETKVLFVLGDDEKLVGLKNKSNGGKSVKKSSKIHNEPLNLDEALEDDTKEKGDAATRSERNTESPSKCCGQTLQHSKPIKHSGFKFEFDKYPQIVTNYMKSKNLEILDRHYIGKPGNLKLDNFQFDPTVVPPIQEERCEACYKCQLMESTLQTPTNASELEFMNDIPRLTEPLYATETLVDSDVLPKISPKTFVRKKTENTILVNITPSNDELDKPTLKKTAPILTDLKVERKDSVCIKEVIEMPIRPLSDEVKKETLCGYDTSLLGGVTDHYVPDLVLQGIVPAEPSKWEAELRRDLDLTTYLNKTLEAPIQSIAIIGDVNKWDVRVVGRSGAGSSGMSALVGAMLDALPHMWRAKVPAHQCLSFLEMKLREFCVLSKTLADMLMTTDFCDITTLTKSLNIDINDVPLLMAVATTHTPQVARRYGLSYT